MDKLSNFLKRQNLTKKLSFQPVNNKILSTKIKKIVHENVEKKLIEKFVIFYENVVKRLKNSLFFAIIEGICKDIHLSTNFITIYYYINNK